MKESGFPESIQAFKFASAAKSIKSSINLASFERLAELLLSSDGKVAFNLQGGCDESGKAQLDLSIEAKLELRCHRCLDAMTTTISNQVVLRPVFNDDQAKDCPDDVEPVFVDDESNINIKDMIEDEIILSLPVAPTHEHECVELPTEEHDERPDEATEASRPNPFAVLQSLKKQ